MVSPRLNWYYYTTEQSNLNNRKLYYPRGRVLGGSSQLNVCCYIRGQPSDYDRWAEKTGSDCFAYENVLPIFKEQQQAVGYGDDYYNGRDGYLKTSKNPLDQFFFGDMVKTWIAAGAALHGENDDPNGKQQQGFGNYPATMFEGFRQSTSTAFIRPIEEKHNLTIVDRALTSKVIIEGGKAKGIEVVDSNRLFKSKKAEQYFGKEIILSGGAINTPQVLQLSGIGPANVLKTAGVECIVDSPGVGAHLQGIYIQP